MERPEDISSRIFVSIAAYRDRDCANTIRDLFAKARNPERITIGLCWQSLHPEDDRVDPVGARPGQCRVVAVDAALAQGVCWARNKVQQLWQDEDYVLQIDSHMRFVADWDVRIIAMLRRCPSERAILTNYPAAFTPPDQIDSHIVSVIYAAGFDRDGMVKQNSYGHAPESMGEVPQPAAFCAGGFLFGDSRWIAEVPYDPYLYFQGEETTLAVRLYTHGWDMFTPTDVLVYHDYNNRPDRPRHWNDRPDWGRLHERSVKRIRHLLGTEESRDSEVLIEIDRYGLGGARSLAEYEGFSGIDFKAATIGGKTAAELEAQTPPEQRRKRNADIFAGIWRDNAWACEESRSGPGSTLAATGNLRRKLLELCGFLGIRQVVDGGCGDMNWMSEICGNFDLYLGLDVVPELIVELDRKYGHRRGHLFAVRDVTIDELPRADAIICRDVLNHLPLDEAKAALTNFKDSASRYLIATTYSTGGNRVIGVGDWQPLDLTAPPFNLPKPIMQIMDDSGEGKSLGVWKMTSLPD